ncbi:hypothetical protein [Streptomyces sp. NK15101]|uniref:hypothetical protein n=1 Tax=Streptomyces sp. NK15101 TaxID=2873261 RepID=UPI001CED35F6|nr:hypothetical protein [Streptomyces sp. NK15101]
MRGPRTRWAAALAVTGALLALPACASSVDPIERLGRKAAERVSPRPSPVQHVRAAVDAKRCEGAPAPRTVTPRSDELALRLTEC